MPETARPLRRRQVAHRTSRPCDLCRRRKTRCIIDSDQASCKLCLHKRKPCTFNEEAPRRLLPGESDNDPNTPIAAEISPLPHDVLDAHHFPGNTGALNSSLHATEQDDCSGMHHSTVNGVIQDDIFAGVLGLQRNKFAELYGLGSDMEPILMRHRPYDAINHEYTLPTHAIRLVSRHDQGVDYPVTFHMVTNEKSVDLSLDNVDVDSIESCVRPHGEKLIRLFWKMVQPTFPIIHKAGFTRLYTESYRNVDAPLLGAMYLIAMNWWHYDPHLSNQPLTDIGGLRRLTLKAILNSYHRPRLSSLEAILLFLQCKPEDPLNPDHTFAWGLTGQALAVSEASGLHLDASAWIIPEWEISLRKRLSWGLYMQDAWTALAHGRPLHIHEDEWGVQDLSLGDFEDQDKDSGISFTYMTTLTKILYSVLKQFYSLKGSTNQDTVQLHAKAQPIFMSLRAWYASLPIAMSMDYMPTRRLCTNGNIHIAYYAVKIALLRRLVRSTALAPLCIDVEVLTSIRQEAHDAANEAISLVASLRLEHLESFWYFAAPYFFSVIGSFCTLLLVTSLTPAERDYWREKLRSYLWTLRVGSKTNEPMRYAANRLEGAVLRGLEHALAVAADATSPIVQEAPLGHAEASYDGYGFALSGFDDIDLSTMDLGAFDFLSNAVL